VLSWLAARNQEDSTVAVNVPLPGIEHVILLMLENRSFDNMLGAFYPSRAGYGGGVPPDYYNPYLSGKLYPWQAPVGPDAQIIPNPDPLELFLDMAAQIDGPSGPMMGFASNYATVRDADPKAVLQYYVAENVPVTHALAMTYAASDRYFASGPVQTWPNRLFSICGTPGYNSATNMAYLDNTDYPDHDVILGQLPWASIFEQLDNHGQDWAVYYDDEVPIAALVRYMFDRWIDPINRKVHWYSTFFDDVKAGNLPSFSLIEPRYQMVSGEGFAAPTSNHPGSSDAFSSSGPPISISCGERMLAQVFSALVGNPGLFAKTLLIVTYDEHGGLFDHVLPPQNQVSPFTRPVGNFDYTSYGVRVPTLFVNPYVRPGLFPPPGLDPPYPFFDHTSILATLRDQFSLSGSLSPRVDSALTFAGLTDPTRQPIPAPTIPLPACTWQPPVPGHAAPVVHSALRRKALPPQR
jgi:phospholipase C